MKRANNSYQHLLIHTCCWALYIGYEQLAVFIVSPVYHLSSGAVYFYVLNISLFYTQAALLHQTHSDRRFNYAVAAGLTALLLLTVTLLKTAGEVLINENTGGMAALGTIIILSMVRSVFYMIAGSGYWIILRNFRLRKQAAAAQNAFLQQQIRPHLLFNTLNFIYSTVYNGSPAGGRAIYLLTQILDHSLEKNTDEKTSLEDEVTQIGNMIELNRLRFDFHPEISFTVSGDLSAFRIIPLVLLTLTENVFVHGSFKNEPAVIRLAVSPEGLLTFQTENTFSLSSVKPGKGSGLANIRTRMAYTYPGRFALEAGRSGKYFITKLNIWL